jgi:hypothetical protein
MSDNGIDIASHGNGVPNSRSGGDGNYTVGHTVLIILGALVAIWALGFAFRSVRLG